MRSQSPESQMPVWPLSVSSSTKKQHRLFLLIPAQMQVHSLQGPRPIPGMVILPGHGQVRRQFWGIQQPRLSQQSSPEHLLGLLPLVLHPGVLVLLQRALLPEQGFQHTPHQPGGSSAEPGRLWSCQKPSVGCTTQGCVLICRVSLVCSASQLKMESFSVVLVPLDTEVMESHVKVREKTFFKV